MNSQMIKNPAHPILKHYLSILRDKHSNLSQFRKAADLISSLLITYATEDLSLQELTIDTPLANSTQHKLSSEIIIAPILRAGLSMVDPFLRIWPNSRVFHLGMRRNEETHIAETYYNNIEPATQASHQQVFILDPMLATGGSMHHSCCFFKEKGYTNIHIVAIIGAPEGIEFVRKLHPEIPITIAAIDDHLNDQAYIVPGLGDAGDRFFGTY